MCEQCDRVAARKLCRACDAADPPLPRGGWLPFALLSLLLTPFSLVVYVLQVARDVRAYGWSACLDSGSWLTMTILSVTALAALSLYAMAIVPHFTRRKRRAPVMMQRFWMANLGVAVVVLLLLKLADPAAPLDGQQLFGGLIAIAWWKYFRDSKHVEATFINE